MTLTMRPYDPANDLQRLLALTQLGNQHGQGSTYLHSGDVVWQLFQNTVFDARRQVRLWQHEDGALAGFAWLEEPDGVIWCVHPRLRGHGLVEPAIVAWAAGEVDPDAPGADGNLWTRLCATDTATLQAMAALGFLEDSRLARKARRSAGCRAGRHYGSGSSGGSRVAGAGRPAPRGMAPIARDT
jgi:hypothetical protein